MKANKLFLLASLLLSGSMIPITAQNKKEKKQQREQAVREAVDAKAYKINVDRVMPMKGGSKHLTSMGHRTKRFFQWSGKMGERF